MEIPNPKTCFVLAVQSVKGAEFSCLIIIAPKFTLKISNP